MTQRGGITSLWLRMATFTMRSVLGVGCQYSSGKPSGTIGIREKWTLGDSDLVELESLDSLIDLLADRANRWMAGSEHYIVLAAFVAGADWRSSRRLLDGFREFLAEADGETNLGWPLAVVQLEFDQADRVSLIRAGASPEQNERATALLLERLSAFADSRRVVDGENQKEE